MIKVLLVDDEALFRTSLAQRLKLRGFEILEACCGTEAVATARKHPDIDVLILDYKMPGMNGDQVLQEIRRFRPGVAAIMLTAYGAERAPDGCCCLQKPCEIHDLVHAIESVRMKSHPDGRPL